MKQIFNRIPNDKILQLESHRSVDHFVSALKLLSGDRSQILRDISNESLNAHNIPMDSQCDDGFSRRYEKF